MDPRPSNLARVFDDSATNGPRCRNQGPAVQSNEEANPKDNIYSSVMPWNQAGDISSTRHSL